MMNDLPAPHSYNQSTEGGCGANCLGFALGLLICFILSLLLAGCKGKELVTEVVEKPVIVTQEHHTESIRVDIVRDTIHQRDSIYHYIKGDTTIIERWHYLQGTTKVAKVDTFIKVDSVQVPVITERVVKEVEQVEKPLHWWQKALIAFGGLCLVAVLLWLTHKLGKMGLPK